jgi:two-component system, NtrC family, response regulator
MPHVLLIDSNESTRTFIKELCSNQAWQFTGVSNPGEYNNSLQQEIFDLIVMDVNQPDGNGLAFIHETQHLPGEPEVIVYSGIQDPEIVEQVIQLNAWDYIEKPGTWHELLMSMKGALKYRSEKMKARTRLMLDTEGIIGRSPAMMECYQGIAQASQSDISVMLTGETGTGKELFARAIHKNSRRTDKNFVIVDCTVLPENLVESVLFGHQRGSFTGAHTARKGLIAQADKGTLFLDEIGELPASIQSSFLRVLQERQYRPVGSTQLEKCDFRLITATNRDLAEEVEKGRFREDLLFRIKGFSLDLPPLREHKEDIRELVLHYADLYWKRYDLKEKTFSRDFWSVLMEYNWPGNTRELIQAVNSAIAEAGHEPILFSKHLPTDIRASAYRLKTEGNDNFEVEAFYAGYTNDDFPTLKDVRNKTITGTESKYLARLLTETQWDIEKACLISGLSRSRLYTLLKKYNITK